MIGEHGRAECRRIMHGFYAVSGVAATCSVVPAVEQGVTTALTAGALAAVAVAVLWN